MATTRIILAAALCPYLLAACAPTGPSDASDTAAVAPTFDVEPAPAQSPAGTWHGEREGVQFYPSGENLAYDRPASTIHPDLTRHSQKMVPGVYQVAENVYLAYGYALTSPAMIVGDDGVIIVDPTEDVTTSRVAFAELRKFSDLPVKAVIYSHWHIDHYAGVAAFTTQEAIDRGDVEIIAHRDFLANMIRNSTGGTGPIIAARVDYSLGTLLEPGPEGVINGGLGPQFIVQDPTLFAPTILIDDVLETTIAGVRMEIRWLPSEAPDEIAVWLPDLEVLHTVEILQGESFPNLHTIRGTRYRDMELWFQAIDVMRELYPAKYTVASHGRPISGYDEVAETLTAYRDAIQYVYDQSLRFINKGFLPDDLVEVVRLPEHLSSHPWLGDFYGGVPHSVRQVYYGELGWFLGDPTFLAPTHPSVSSERYVELMGGRDAVYRAAAEADRAGDHQWAAELTTHLIRNNNADQEARDLKADALRQIGYTHTNINWRNWYLTSAEELAGTIDFSRRLDVQAPDMLRAFPTANLIDGFRYRLKAEEVLDVNMTMGFRFPDTGEELGLEIRRGIVQFYERRPDSPDVVMEMDRATLDGLIIGELDMGGKTGVHPETPQDKLGALFDSGAARLTTGTPQAFARFFSYFEPISSDPIPITIN
jgi:alkyl sulfatase BDS1-like metallo-beta-lactamase superfamily hydrolase